MRAHQVTWSKFQWANVNLILDLYQTHIRLALADSYYGSLVISEIIISLLLSSEKNSGKSSEKDRNCEKSRQKRGRKQREKRPRQKRFTRKTFKVRNSQKRNSPSLSLSLWNLEINYQSNCPTILHDLELIKCEFDCSNKPTKVLIKNLHFQANLLGSSQRFTESLTMAS